MITISFQNDKRLDLNYFNRELMKARPKALAIQPKNIQKAENYACSISTVLLA